MAERARQRFILIADIGNTDTVFGLFRDSAPVATWRVPDKHFRTRNDVWNRIDRHLRASRIEPDDVKGAAISSVNPGLTRLAVSAIRQHLHIIPIVIDGTLDIGMKLRYKNPRLLGPDRICNAYAARHIYGGPVIAVDCGTATTFDLVNARGEYCGGAIAAGLRTSADALTRSTARLPGIDLSFPKHDLGTDTVSCMKSGVLLGAVDSMNGMMTRLKKITGDETKVVLTGGYSKLLAPHVTHQHELEPLLVLKGALMIYSRIEGRRKHPA